MMSGILIACTVDIVSWLLIRLLIPVGLFVQLVTA